MSRRRSSLLAWSSAAAGISLAASGALVATLGERDDGGDFVVFFALVLPLVAASSVVGALVASQRPQNPIGWILCGFGVVMGLASLASGYAQVAPDDATRGAGQWAAWFANSSWPALFALAVFVLLLFPDGRLLPGRRRAAWAGAAGTACLAAGSAVEPGPLVDFPAVENPVGGDPTLSAALVLAGAALTLAALAAGVAAVVGRYRRAGETGRQQIKWLAVAAVVTAVGTTAGITVAILGAEVAGYSLVLLSVLAVPVAIGVAILRYRLYDVDRVISRSLTYALVTVTLAAAYAGLVLAGQAVFASFAGGGDLRSRSRRSSSRRSSSPYAPACRASSTGGSAGAATTPPARSSRSARGCASRSSWTRCAPTSRASSVRRSSPPAWRSGFETPIP